MCATCFGPFSGHHQVCQYKNHLKKDKLNKIQGVPRLQSPFPYNIKIQNIKIPKTYIQNLTETILLAPISKQELKEGKLKRDHTALSKIQ